MDQSFWFYRDFKAHPLRTLQTALEDKQLQTNSKILRYQHEFKKTGFRVFCNTTVIIIAIKILTNLTHYSRSLALSAPKNLGAAFLKYMMIPALGNYYLQHDRYNQMMSTIDQLKDKDIQNRYRELLKIKSKIMENKKV